MHALIDGIGQLAWEEAEIEDQEEQWKQDGQLVISQVKRQPLAYCCSGWSALLLWSVHHALEEAQQIPGRWNHDQRAQDAVNDIGLECAQQGQELTGEAVQSR